MKTNPGVAFRDCDLCRKLWYDEKTGEPHKSKITGEPLPRPEKTLPCEDHRQSCPKGHYSNPKTLSDRNAMCYQYIKEGLAVNWKGVPCDSVTRRNAAIVADIEGSVEKAEQYRLMSLGSGLAGLMGVGHGSR